MTAKRKPDDPFLVKVLNIIIEDFDGIDNGYCKMCHVNRLYNLASGYPQPCPNNECFSHSLNNALATYKAEREMLIYWLIRAYGTLGREGWEEGRTDDETRYDLLSVLANLGYDPNQSAQADELITRPPAYFTEGAKELWAKK